MKRAILSGKGRRWAERHPWIYSDDVASVDTNVRKRDELVDPWGRVFAYRFPGEYGDFDLYSLGADGIEGGEGENADVTSW